MYLQKPPDSANPSSISGLALSVSLTEVGSAVTFLVVLRFRHPLRRVSFAAAPRSPLRFRSPRPPARFHALAVSDRGLFPRNRVPPRRVVRSASNRPPSASVDPSRDNRALPIDFYGQRITGRLKTCNISAPNCKKLLIIWRHFSTFYSIHHPQLVAFAPPGKLPVLPARIQLASRLHII